MKNQRITKLTVAGLLIGIGIIIPMFSPIKFMVEPVSFTLASHVAIFIAMFISPAVAVSVAVGTTLGFFLGGFPIIIVIRAATHVIFTFIGSMYLHRMTSKPLSAVRLRVFSLIIGVIHSLGELVVVSYFWVEGNIATAYLENGFVRSVILVLGLGSVIHSMVDFEIARFIVMPLKKQKAVMKQIKIV